MQVGHGKEAFERAKEALSRWEHFQLGWAIVDPDTPVKEDTRVCVESKPVPFLPIWTACPLRIVYAPVHSRSLMYAGAYHLYHAACALRGCGVCQAHQVSA